MARTEAILVNCILNGIELKELVLGVSEVFESVEDAVGDADEC